MGASDIPVYVVANYEGLRNSLHFMLGAMGHAKVRSFADGTPFLAELDSLPPGIVLLDMRVRQPDGFSILERIDARRKDQLAVITLVDRSDLPMAMRARKLRLACDFMIKPFSAQDLKTAFGRCQKLLHGQLSVIGIRQAARSRLAVLDPMEMRILSAIANGLPARSIATDLGLDLHQVRMARGNLKRRLGVVDSASMLKIAYDAGVPAKLASPARPDEPELPLG
ncbi:response regulator transcription factor [Alteraurantiacibacter aquimixticola]|uniref:Response regulator n=1 Tax=Alteraurantiacibacter aquimixticola TaxID=2489173 RepID=A0A4T3F2Q6_9SPHN|nr:response regulator [Alteraurantiacibacter aquimixticola]TIX51545.1 response regulator [Alteraurantiacibacter aquimixticola]